MKLTSWMFAVSLSCFTFAAVAAEGIDPSQGIADPCSKESWYDGKLLLLEGKGWQNTESHYDRLPAMAKDKVRAPIWNLSHDSAGMCLRFLTEATSIRIRWTLRQENLALPHMPATGVSGIDLYMKVDNGRWMFAGNGRPSSRSNEASFRVIPRAECLLYLPLYNGVESVEIGVPRNKALSKPVASSDRPNKPVVFYGTSITQGGCASRPGMACTALVGRQLDVPVINLGFSGNGKMEPEMADLLVELDPAAYVLDCLWNMNPAEVSERVGPFVRKLRGARPDTPILLVEDSSVSNTTPTEKGSILRRIYGDLQAGGIGDLHFLSNRDMLGTDGDGTVDGCHPNDLGMMRQAAVFSKSLAAILRTASPNQAVRSDAEAVMTRTWMPEAQPPSNPQLPTLFLIGDSTVRTGSKGNGANGQWGWGSPLGDFFDRTRINVENRAWGGTSSRTFATQGFWDKVLVDLKPGDYVMMQFGHNDGSPINDRQRARGTIPGVGAETQEIDNLLTGKHEIVRTYGWYIRRYISEVKAKGATAIVCSPIPRNNWRDGRVIRASNDYGRWAAEAAEAEGAFFLNLNATIADRYDRLGENHVSAAFFGPQDHTHTVAAGARFNAQCVVDGIKALECPLADYLLESSEDPKPLRASCLISRPALNQPCCVSRLLRGSNLYSSHTGGTIRGARLSLGDAGTYIPGAPNWAGLIRSDDGFTGTITPRCFEP
jgi:lysophospholipase L1-like esterase